MKKNVIKILIVFLISVINLYAGKIYVVDQEYKADVKVFVVKHNYQANLLVYKVDQEYKSKSHDGLWFFVKHKHKADVKIYFVKYEYKADVKIKYVKQKYQAKWNKVNAFVGRFYNYNR
jgi:hypothetical protein